MDKTYMTKNFTKEELECKCGCGKLPKDDFIHELQLLRNYFGKPMVVTSGARCERYNKKINGAPGSAHILGVGVDIAFDMSDVDSLWHFIKFATMLDFEGIIVYPRHVHLDMKNRGNKKFATGNY